MYYFEQHMVTWLCLPAGCLQYIHQWYGLLKGWFLLCDAMPAWYILLSCVCLSICLSDKLVFYWND